METTNDATRASAEAMPEDTPDFLDLADSLQKAKEYIDCIYLAGHGLGDHMKRNAIVRVASDAADVIERVRDRLENYCAGGRSRHADDNGGTNEDRFIVSVGHLLSEMIEAYGATHVKICNTEGIADEADVDRMLAIALSIIGYRALTKGDERRKAEFLREYRCNHAHRKRAERPDCVHAPGRG